MPSSDRKLSYYFFNKNLSRDLFSFVLRQWWRSNDELMKLVAFVSTLSFSIKSSSLRASMNKQYFTIAEADWQSQPDEWIWNELKPATRRNSSRRFISSIVCLVNSNLAILHLTSRKNLASSFWPWLLLFIKSNRPKLNNTISYLFRAFHEQTVYQRIIGDAKKKKRT